MRDMLAQHHINSHIRGRDVHVAVELVVLHRITPSKRYLPHEG